MDLHSQFLNFKSFLNPYLIEIASFRFYLSNLVIWVSLFLIFLFLAPRWKYKKALLFSFLLGVAIFCINPLESVFVGGLGLERGVMGLVVFFLVSLVVIYFVFLKDSD